MSSALVKRRGRLMALTAAQPPPLSAGDPLEIRDLRAYPLEEPVSGRRYTLLRLAARNGMIGWGECAGASLRDLAQTRQLMIGQPATAWEPARRRLVAVARQEGAIHMAMLDLVGQYTKVPVYQVLGGPTRNKARALAPLEGSSDEALAASLARARQAGYRAFLVPVPPPSWLNQGQSYVLGARRRLDALRAAAGPGADFVLDGHGALTPGDAASLAEAFERFRLLWFDEPCPVSNLAALRKISAENVTPVGFGRRIQHAGIFQDLLREEAVDVLRPSLAETSLLGIRKVAAMAETHYVAVAPFHDGGPVATAAALHLAASLPNFFIQQIPLPAAAEDRAMRAEIAGEPIERVRDGFATLPADVGLGVRVNEKALEKYAERAA